MHIDFSVPCPHLVHEKWLIFFCQNYFITLSLHLSMPVRSHGHDLLKAVSRGSSLLPISPGETRHRGRERPDREEERDLQLLLHCLGLQQCLLAQHVPVRENIPMTRHITHGLSFLALTGSPGAPGAPMSPWWPATPLGPCFPLGPENPAAPKAPRGPWSPAGPVTPGAPDSPGDPASPNGPGGPYYVCTYTYEVSSPKWLFGILLFHPSHSVPSRSRDANFSW